MNPYEVGNLEPYDPEAGSLSRFRMAIDILARVFFGIAILGMLSFSWRVLLYSVCHRKTKRDYNQSHQKIRRRTAGGCFRNRARC